MSLDKKNFVFVVYKATSELDFITPLIWHIKMKYPTSNPIVLYAVPNKVMILRKAQFYSDLFKLLNVKEYDFSDFTYLKKTFLSKIFIRLFSYSYWDGVSVNMYVGVLQRILNKLVKILELFFYYVIDYKKITNKIKPDLFFFALRNYAHVGKKKTC